MEPWETDCECGWTVMLLLPLSSIGSDGNDCPVNICILSRLCSRCCSHLLPFHHSADPEFRMCLDVTSIHAFQHQFRSKLIVSEHKKKNKISLNIKNPMFASPIHKPSVSQSIQSNRCSSPLLLPTGFLNHNTVTVQVSGRRNLEHTLNQTPRALRNKPNPFWHHPCPHHYP